MEKKDLRISIMERRGDGSRSPTPPPHSAPVVPSKGLRFSPEVEEMEMGRAAEFACHDNKAMEVVKEEEEPTAEANNINSISRASSHQPVAVSFSAPAIEFDFDSPSPPPPNSSSASAGNHTSANARGQNNTNRSAKRRPPLLKKQSTELGLRAESEKQRSESLKKMREILDGIVGGGGGAGGGKDSNGGPVEASPSSPSSARRATLEHLSQFLRSSEVTACIFRLFDSEFMGQLDQEEWLEMLRANLARASIFNHATAEAKEGLLEMLDTLSEERCKQGPIQVGHLHGILSGRGMTRKLFKLADAEDKGEVSVQKIMDVFITLSKKKESDEVHLDQIRHLEGVFQQFLLPGKETMCQEEFCKMIGSKNDLFAERVFKVIDTDGTGCISQTEFVQTMSQLSAAEDTDNKVMLLFRIYDITDDGKLSSFEIEEVMQECLSKSGITLPANDVHDLALSIIKEGKKKEEGEEEEEEDDDDDIGEDEIDVDQLKRAFQKHPELLDNLSFIMSKFLLPPVDPSKVGRRRSLSWRRRLLDSIEEKAMQARKNWQMYLFLFAIFAVNVVVFVVRACDFVGMRGLDGKQNYFYMISRACGKCLIVDGILILALVLRGTLTRLRNLGANQFLPLDEHIYLHKVVGVLICFLSCLHTLMHLINFAVNVAPDPVKLLLLNLGYWGLEDGLCPLPDKPICGAIYRFPSKEGCRIAQDCLDWLWQNRTYEYEGPCQVCDDGGWSYATWLFTLQPGVFGLVRGIANPTGIILIVINLIMTVFSMPFIRRSRFFQIFYTTHLMYYAFFVLLILHAPVFWKCILAPGVIFIVEKATTAIAIYRGRGRTHIVDGVPLASRVTKLVISRPAKFRFSAGDYVFIRIPQISSYEWHAFTISSAPEQMDKFTLHVRAVGHWTNKLYEYYEYEKMEGKEVVRIVREKEAEATVENYALESARRASLWSGGGDERIVIPSQVFKRHRLEVQIEGPFGAPASSIFQAQHAVLIATGIGVTPFSSILQSIMFRYMQGRRMCPNCDHVWSEEMGKSIGNLTKVDFIWINRDQKSFEWFVSLLDKMEQEQGREETQNLDKFINFHLFMTKALEKSDMRAVGLRLAMDLLHDKEKRDIMTKLKVKTSSGRPNWNRIFHNLTQEGKGNITIFYCGNPFLAKSLKTKARDWGFNFRKEVF